MNRITILAFLCLLTGVQMGCKTSKSDPCAHNFDQTAYLQHTANNIIVPRYLDFQTKATAMNTAIASFAQQPTQTALDSARTAFRATYLAWQRVAMFEFGIAETQQMRLSMNSYPVYVAKLNQTITAGGYNLDDPTLQYTRGLPALDYLLYGVGANDADILAKYTTDSLATRRKQYLQDVTTWTLNKVNTTVNSWLPSGSNYTQTFINNTGIATGTSISFIVNQLSSNYEEVKNSKLGTPLGVKVSYVPSSNKAEAYYSGMSFELMEASILATKELFLGYANGVNGNGLDDFLGAVETDGAATLATTIVSQLDAALSRVASFKTTYSSWANCIDTDMTNAKKLYADVQKQMLYIKTDMPSLLCISITYADLTDDGD